MLAVPVLALAVMLQPPAKQPADTSFGIPADSPEYWPVHVLTSPDVQKELNLTAGQAKKLAALRAELDKRVQAGFGLAPNRMPAHFAAVARWADAAVADLLTAEQYPRFRQITWQVIEHTGGAPGLAANPAFARAIGLSADQLKQARKAQADFQAAWQKLVAMNPLGGTGTLPGEAQLRAKADEAVLQLLTAEQKKKWNQALGEPFKGDVYLLPGMPPFKAPAEKK